MDSSGAKYGLTLPTRIASVAPKRTLAMFQVCVYKGYYKHLFYRFSSVKFAAFFLVPIMLGSHLPVTNPVSGGNAVT